MIFLNKNFQKLNCILIFFFGVNSTAISMKLYNAAWRLDLPKIKRLVKQGQDINQRLCGRELEDILSIVASRSEYKYRLSNIRFCISLGSRLDPKIHAYTWLCIIDGGDISEVQGLLDRFPSMLSTRFFGAGQDGLCSALIGNDSRMVTFLLGQGANPNQYTGWFKSTLHRAECEVFDDQSEVRKCAEIIRNSEFAILLLKSAKYGASAILDSCDTVSKNIAQTAMTSLLPDLQIELASYFW